MRQEFDDASVRPQAVLFGHADRAAAVAGCAASG
jgi:hypothetical protein